jgi:Cu(I)/Ag(I) efflux system protein CusF
MRRINGMSNGRSSKMSVVVASLALLGGLGVEQARAFEGNRGIDVAQAAEKAIGKGVVKGINKEERKLRIAHEPIPALQWPAMVMAFSVAPNVDVSTLSEGAKITFTLSKGASGGYVIEEIRRTE